MKNACRQAVQTYMWTTCTHWIDGSVETQDRLVCMPIDTHFDIFTFLPHISHSSCLHASLSKSKTRMGREEKMSDVVGRRRDSLHFKANECTLFNSIFNQDHHVIVVIIYCDCFSLRESERLFFSLLFASATQNVVHAQSWWWSFVHRGGKSQRAVLVVARHSWLLSTTNSPTRQVIIHLSKCPAGFFTWFHS